MSRLPSDLPQDRADRISLVAASQIDRLDARLYSSQRFGSIAPFPEAVCIHELFEQQAMHTPDATALICRSQHITYRRLNRYANQIAHQIRSLGNTTEALIGLCMEPSIEQIASVLGILKAGAAYVPLDPSYPQDRLAFMLADTATPLILTQPQYVERLSVHSTPIITIEPTLSVSEVDDCNLTGVVEPHNLAYVIYTSGSTGLPKGVLIEHRGLVNHTMAIVQSHKLDPSDRVLQFSSLGFDASASTLFPALISGATLVLPPIATTMLLGDQLTQCCEQHQISILQLPTAVWHQWVDDLQARGQPLRTPIKVMLVGGESPSVAKLQAWARLHQDTMIFLNAYGPTEATITTTLFELSCNVSTSTALDIIPLGLPLANKQVYLFDEQQEPVMQGSIGEIYIGGIGLARGYLNRPELTAERFIANPFGPGRLYRTGDLARIRPDGNLEFLGRIDHQIKLRGFRIELGEIEATLRLHPTVRDAVVIARPDSAGLSQLIAFVVAYDALPHHTLNEALLKHLEAQLPAYMIPAALIQLDRLPLTINGKLDRQALPNQANLSVHRRPAADQGTVEEHMLAEIWAQALGRPTIGLDDSFFELGGYSLSAAYAITLVNRAFSRDLPVRLIFEAPTVAAFARAMREDGSAQQQPNAARLWAEVTLDPTISPASHAQPIANSPSQAIFLTGATGFLGASVLCELLRSTEAQIYCLVRGQTEQEARLRLLKAVEAYHIEPAAQQRIVPVLGDLRKPQFGLSSSAFEYLATTIEVIFHAGAQVHYLYPYTALKATNVQGTVEVLRLACQKRLKPVHYVSTLATALPTVEEPISYEDGELRDCLSSKGYDQSKWVAEGVVRLARERGVPVTIYRPGRIGSHSKSGIWNSDDFLKRLIDSCMQLGLAPELPLVENLLPVDYAAQSIVFLAAQPSLANSTFHLLNPQPTGWRWLIEALGELGWPLSLVPYATWHQALMSVAALDPLHPLCGLVSYLSAEPAGVSWVQGLTDKSFDMRNTFKGLAESHIQCPPIDNVLIERMLAAWSASATSNS